MFELGFRDVRFEVQGLGLRVERNARQVARTTPPGRRHMGPRHVKRLASPDMPFSQEARFGAASAARSCWGLGLRVFWVRGSGLRTSDLGPGVGEMRFWGWGAGFRV